MATSETIRRGAIALLSLILAALDYVPTQAKTKWPFEQFRKGLDSDNEEGKWQMVNASLNGAGLAVKG